MFICAESEMKEMLKTYCPVILWRLEVADRFTNLESWGADGSIASNSLNPFHGNLTPCTKATEIQFAR
jgi:hypothetical protein